MRAKPFLSLRLLPCAAVAASLLGAQVAWAAPVTLVATLSGVAETAGGDAKGSGGFKVTLDPETNDFCYSLWADKATKPTMVHLHAGAAGVDGDAVATLEVTGQDNDACLAIDKDKLQPLADNPSGFYVNIHTAAFPKGALRGQLVKE
ncbi:MAG: hypothetical protein RLZZ136_1817 [Pseudomonadota bacterium]|jgi:hypothetical protein